jgi:hypothetical protein
MDWERLHRWEFLMHSVSQQTPDRLRRSNIPALKILCNLVGKSQPDCSPVWAFVGVFSDILNDLDTATELNVDVAVIADREVWVIWHNPAIIHSDLTALHMFGKCHIRDITPAILGVSMLVRDRLRGERLREVLTTGSFTRSSVTRGTGGL